MEGFRHTDRGLPRVPSTIDSLVGAVSHEAWATRDLATMSWQTPVHRSGPGEYDLDDAVGTILSEASAEAFTLHRLGTE